MARDSQPKLRDNPNKLLGKTVGNLPPMPTTVTITDMTISFAVKDWKNRKANPSWYDTILEAELTGEDK